MSEKITRRQALGVAGVGALVGGANLLRGVDPAVGSNPSGLFPMEAGWRQDPMPQLPPVGEMVSAFDFETGARATLPSEVFDAVAGGDREVFDRMTFRPRMNVPAMEMDLSVTLLDTTLYTPVIVAPFADHGAYHRDAELATVQGASRSFAPVVVSRHSTLPFEALVEAAEVPLWYAVYEDDPDGPAAVRRAVESGAGAVFLTLRASYSPRGGVRRPGSVIDWGRVERFAAGLAGPPLVLKGIETAEEADRAVAIGASGVVVSTHGASDVPHPLDRISPIVNVIGGRVPIFVDGSVRRGTDVLKALILGAQGVLVGRPIAWGLATHGADGVATVLRLIQNELGRSMAMLGAPTLADLTRNHLRVHTRATS